MDVDFSYNAAKAWGAIHLDAEDKITVLIQGYLGFAVSVSVTISDDPRGIRLESSLGIIVVDWALTTCVDLPESIKIH